MYEPYLLYPLICQWTFSCFNVFTISNSVEMNIGVPVSFEPYFALDVRPGEGLLDRSLIQYFFLPFHNVHGVLKARMLKWFTIPFSRVPCCVRTLHYDPCVLGGPVQLIVSLSYKNLWFMFSFWVVFCDCGFLSVCPLMDEDKRLVQASWSEGLAMGKTGSSLVGGACSVIL